MTNSTRQRTGAVADRGRDTFTGAIQWEMLSEEGRPLLWSHFVSSALGLTFLMLVFFGPQPLRISDDKLWNDPGMKVDMEGMIPESRLMPTNRSGGDRASTGSGSQRGQETQGALAAAFDGGRSVEPGGMAGAASGVLQGVQTNSGTGYAGLASMGAAGQGGKAVLSGGGSGNGSTGLGRAGIGDGSGRIGGGVGGGGSVTRSVVSVSRPSVIAQELPGPGRDVSQLGSIVRDRQAVLQSCYTREGLAVNPKLAGTIDVAITLGGAGGVTRVNATPRSMSGPGTSQVMSCIEGQIQRWKFPASEAGSGTYSFPFSFTS